MSEAHTRTPYAAPRGAHGRFPAGLDPQPTLRGETIRLRPLAEADREALWQAIRDPLIWEQHPARNRHERPVFERYFAFLLSTGGTLVVEDRAGRVIGTSTFYGEPPDGTPEGSGDARERPSIGFTFLAREHWGGGTNFELKRLMLDHLFAHADTAWLHIGPDNIRSQRATGRLGARYVRDATLNTTGAPALTQCWRLDRDAWERVRDERLRSREGRLRSRDERQGPRDERRPDANPPVKALDA